MIKSMTGYGKSEAILANGKLTIEIRTLNAKSADVNLKSSLLPKDKEIAVRQKIAESLQRGTIDVFLTWEANAAENAKQINMDLARDYFRQISALAAEMGRPNIGIAETGHVIESILRMPDVIDSRKQDIITDENWPLVDAAFDRCLAALNAFRDTEGAVLYKDVTSRVANILALSHEIEGYEAERIENVRARIMKSLEELQQKPDKERFEQEMVFYLEKLDINEERVRLRQHCQYFMDT
ncbi:MAG: hypothetical protein KBT08_07530, partial [Bacteroidales bacterium]|nr:hypothetical protein [Candidatus Cryptobacteroides onthequi]